MAGSNATTYNPYDLFKLWRNGAKFGSYTARHMNLSTDFNIAEDSSNNKYDISLASLVSSVSFGSYTIYIDTNGSVKAKNNFTGAIDYTTPSAPANAADTTSLFNNVFTALQAIGGLVLIKRGTYNTSLKVNVGNSAGTAPTVAITVLGEGLDQTIIQFSSSSTADRMFQVYCNGTFRDMTIDGNGKSLDWINCGTPGSRLTTERVHFLNSNINTGPCLASFATHGVSPSGCASHISRNCWYDKTSNGDQCAIGVTDFTLIEGNVFDKRTAGSGTNGTTSGSTLTSGGVNELIVRGNTMYKVSGDQGPGLSIEPWGSDYHNVIIEGNTLVNCRLSIGGLSDWSATQGANTSLYQNVNISKNILYGYTVWCNGPSTMAAGDDTGASSIQQLNIEGNIIYKPLWAGIWASNIVGPCNIKNNLVFDSNLVTGANDNALIAVERVNRCEVEGNNLKMSGTTSNLSPYGILYNNGCTHLRIHGNRINNIPGTNPSITSTFSGGNSDIKILDNEGYLTNLNGVTTFSGNASLTAFTVTHGLAITPTIVQITTNQNIHAFVSAITSTTFTVTFVSAPATGTNNISVYWHAEKTTGF